MGRMYGEDVLAGDWRRRRTVPEVDAEPDLVVEDADSRVLRRRGRVRVRRGGAGGPARPAAQLSAGAGRVPAGRVAGDAAPAAAGQGAGRAGAARPPVRSRSPAYGPRSPRPAGSGSRAIHDAALVERIWGDDLRIEGVVVEPLDGIDELAARGARVRPRAGAPARRAGRPPGRRVEGEPDRGRRSTSPHVLVTGHPYVDVWQAVKPARLGIRAWPVVPPGQPWKEGVCAALGVAEPAELWRRILSRVRQLPGCGDAADQRGGAADRLRHRAELTGR